MGALTRMTWPQTTLLEVLEGAEKDAGDTFDMVSLELNDGRSFVVAVVCGDRAEAVHRFLEDLKYGSN